MKESTTVLQQLEKFLHAAYCEKNDNPVYQFNNDEKGNKIFTTTDVHGLFLFESVTIGIEHESESDRAYFIKKDKEGNRDKFIPVWTLISYSTILLKDEKQRELIYAFRRTAYHTRKYDQEILPIRGPKILPIGLLEYTISKVVTDWKRFTSTDLIIMNKEEAFKGSFSGGLLLSEESLEALMVEI